MEWEAPKPSDPFCVLQVLQNNLQDETWCILVMMEGESMVCAHGLTDDMERLCHMGRKLQ